MEPTKIEREVKKKTTRAPRTASPSDEPARAAPAPRHARRSTMRVLLALLGAMLSGFLSAQEARPNILFVFSDDHAPHAIGAYDAI